MGRVKEQMMILQEQEFAEELSYQEYLEEESNEPSGIEIMDMAREMLSPATFSEMFKYVYSCNNVGYKSGLSSS